MCRQSLRTKDGAWSPAAFSPVPRSSAGRGPLASRQLPAAEGSFVLDLVLQLDAAPGKRPQAHRCLHADGLRACRPSCHVCSFALQLAILPHACIEKSSCTLGMQWMPAAWPRPPSDAPSCMSHTQQQQLWTMAGLAAQDVRSRTGHSGLHSAEHQPEAGHLATDAEGRMLLVLHSSVAAQAVAIRLPLPETPRGLPEVSKTLQGRLSLLTCSSLQNADPSAVLKCPGHCMQRMMTEVVDALCTCCSARSCMAPLHSSHTCAAWHSMYHVQQLGLRSSCAS